MPSKQKANTATDISTYPPAAIRVIDLDDLKDALAKGLDDFKAKPSHIIILAVIYPLVGLIAARVAGGYDVLHLVFPMVSGFALIGPLAAIGLYDLSKRREQGLDFSWTHALDIIRSPSIGSIFTLSVVLGVIYLAWLGAAQAIYWLTFGDAVPESIPGFIWQVMTTPAGWTLVIVGCGVGFVFALAVLAISSISFPMLLDRNVGAKVAIQTSVNAFLANPKTMLMWGLIVTAALILGSLPLFVGLAIVMPVIGHGTWHLYRKVVAH
jgi:uncharacterized membrane protein